MEGGVTDRLGSSVYPLPFRPGLHERDSTGEAPSLTPSTSSFPRRAQMSILRKSIMGRCSCFPRERRTESPGQREGTGFLRWGAAKAPHSPQSLHKSAQCIFLIFQINCPIPKCLGDNLYRLWSETPRLETELGDGSSPFFFGCCLDALGLFWQRSTG